ncbi:MAG: hypothetical protein JWO09_1189 [Bacteroidetes bacterium]|nr:hypothetical protein [Bacteroidota bacterium]
MEEHIKRDAYLKGLKLKNTGLDEETICIRLEKQGIPYDLAQEVAKNVFLQRQIDAVNNQPAPVFSIPKRPIISILIDEIRLWFQMRKQK